jgi:hypothetical protein
MFYQELPMNQTLFFPDWRDKVIFSAQGPQPQVLHEDDKMAWLALIAVQITRSERRDGSVTPEEWDVEDGIRPHPILIGSGGRPTNLCLRMSPQHEGVP